MTAAPAPEPIETQFRTSDFESFSPVMQSLLRVARRVAKSDSSLLILGETGVGKERLARAIHNESLRSSGPFVTINTGALPESLLESELFGHEEGAFTGAVRARRGYFELAHQGTIFLDEVGDMPFHLQVRLLRVLEERRVQRIGSEKSIAVDVRVMAATNRDLRTEIAAKRFRQDLYYRLGVLTLTIPPLRERPEDIPLLVERYLQSFRDRLGGEVPAMGSAAMDLLIQHAWPGNVRELINLLERAVLLCHGPEIMPCELQQFADLQPPGTESVGGRPEFLNSPDWVSKPWKAARSEVLAAFERAYIMAMLRATRGRVGEAAKRAGIEARSLFDKMRRHGLRKEDFRLAQPPSHPGQPRLSQPEAGAYVASLSP